MKKEFRARHILVEFEYEAKDILKKLNNGESFSKLAMDFSQCSSSTNGGDLGVFPKGAMVDQFERAMLKLKRGEFSAPVRTQFGYHIIERLPLDYKESNS